MTRAFFVWLPVVAIAFMAACSGPSAGAIGLVAPSESSFPPLADYMDHRCGSLDCHGNSQRNLVMWGCDGLRLESAEAAAGDCLNGTTDDEYEASYRSLVGLEPAVMTQVVQSGGKDMDLLTFVRKARGEESHKGGVLITPGDAQDTCIALWLAGSSMSDQSYLDACNMALSSP